MSRYIDISDLSIPSDENDYDELVAFADKVAEMITDAPSIDIVFCKECKYADKCSQNVAMRDTYQMYEKINFCSVGERREP